MILIVSGDCGMQLFKLVRSYTIITKAKLELPLLRGGQRPGCHL